MPTDDTQSRRQFLGTVSVALGAMAVTGRAARGPSIRAIGNVNSLNDGAVANMPAVRIIPTTSTAPPTTVLTTSVPGSTAPIPVGRIAMPVAPLNGGLVCLNNFNGYSNARGACGHRGTDIGENVDGTPGRPLLACVDGVIERDETLSSGGNMRILFGDDGRWYRYHHLDAYEESVLAGDRVRSGQTIGYMGKTGNTSWTHLHFEVWETSPIPSDGTAIDPVLLIDFPSTVQLDASRACDSPPSTGTVPSDDG